MSSGTGSKTRARTQAPPVVFIRNGWLDWYDDRKDGGKGPIGGGRFNQEGVGSETNNFRTIRGRLLGYVQISQVRGGFNLGRIDREQRGGDVADGVTVLSFATDPLQGGQVLVGWHRRAVCHAEFPGDRPRNIYGIYNFESDATDAVLLPLDRRTLFAPDRFNGGFGQHNVRYAINTDGTPDVLPWMKKALAFVDEYDGPNLLRRAAIGELAARLRREAARSEPSRAWIVKAKRHHIDLALDVRAGDRDEWWSTHIPKGFAPGDRLYFWQGSPTARLCAHGVVTGLRGERADGKQRIDVEYGSDGAADGPGIDELRSDLQLQDATFLQVGPAGTFFPLTDRQESALLAILEMRGWSNLPDVELEPDVVEAHEGEEVLSLRTHRRRERRLRNAKIAAVKRATNAIACEVCSFDFAQTYGEDFAEVHHTRPIGARSGSEATSLDELAVVCANCHRILHLGGGNRSLDDLRAVVRTRRLKGA